ncbi:hypothetical protein B0H11DRAFT_1801955 [Mycena galericulata]|nr:hypothetical protein B0H11DRAFT_1801955 [Mycena galericulata]
MRPFRQARRTATTVLAGDFDVSPPHVPMLRTDNDEIEREKRNERKRKRAKLPVKRIEAVDDAPVTNASPSVIKAPSTAATSFWLARPSIHIATIQRAASVTPPLLLRSTPASTPGPSNSFNTSRTSFKRPRPEDYEDLAHNDHPRPPPLPSKPRTVSRKGWKGWVEGSPPPSEKLISLAPVLPGRRTRNGKNFDAIGVAKDGWI